MLNPIWGCPNFNACWYVFTRNSNASTSDFAWYRGGYRWADTQCLLDDCSEKVTVVQYWTRDDILDISEGFSQFLGQLRGNLRVFRQVIEGRRKGQARRVCTSTEKQAAFGKELPLPKILPNLFRVR